MATSDPQHDQELARYREYLTLLIRMQVRSPLQAQLDLSGVVQQTLLEAHQAWDRLEGRSEGEKAAWLRRALANNLNDALRQLRTARRDVDRQCSLEQDLEQSSLRVAAWLAAEQSSPSEQVVHREQTLLLAEALVRLPDNQRWAIELKHLEGLTLAETAERMDTTTPAVVGLLHRGMEQLRRLLREED